MINYSLSFLNDRKLARRIKYHEKALKINKEIGNRKDEALDLFNIGSTFMKRGERGKALRYYEDALEIFIQIGAQMEIEKIKAIIKRLKGE